VYKPQNPKPEARNPKWFDKLTILSQVEGQIRISDFDLPARPLFDSLGKRPHLAFWRIASKKLSIQARQAGIRINKLPGTVSGAQSRGLPHTTPLGAVTV
jgi:hypothetical protein